MEHYKLNHYHQYQSLKAKKKHSKKEKAALQAYEHLEGGGFFDSVKDLISKGVESVKSVFSPRKAFSKADDKIYKQFGDKMITKLSVVRTPLDKGVQTLVNLLSLGSIKSQQQKLGYDQIYHLYLEIYLEGKAQPLLFEKNETVRLEDKVPAKTSKTQSMDIPITKPLTLQQFVMAGQQRMGDDYWHYTFDKLNCQNFVQNNLAASDLLTPELTTFIMQDAATLVAKTNPIAKKIMQGVTDVAAFGRKLLGKGLKGGVLSEDEGAAESEGEIDEGGKLKMKKSKVKIPIKKTGSLKKFGYNSKEPATKRHVAINKAIREYGAGSVEKKLMAIANLQHNRNPRIASIFRADAHYASKKIKP